jgi:hypothetical protein
MMNSLPTKTDINRHDSLDERLACKNFLGKSLSDVEGMLSENSAAYQEDFMWMGTAGFNYYVSAVNKYLESDSSNDDDQFVFGWLNTVTFRLDNPGDHLDQEKILETVDCILRIYDKYSVDEGIYGDLRSEFARLRERLLGLGSNNRGSP